MARLVKSGSATLIDNLIVAGFMVSLVSALLGYLIFMRILSSLSAWYSKLTKS
jgi:ABC-type Mn2+/Zn2+ transport system permease subunit